MNWDAIGAVGELVGAFAVVLTLGYLAVQVNHARKSSSDINRLSRITGARDWMSLMIGDRELLEAWTKTDGTREKQAALAVELGLTVEEVAKVLWGCQYWWWLHWGQWASTTSKRDVEELRHLISEFYSMPPMVTVWRSGIYTDLLDPSFCAFVTSAINKKLSDVA